MGSQAFSVIVNFFSREDHADVDHLWGRNSDKCF